MKNQADIMDNAMIATVPEGNDVQASILVVEDDAASSGILCKILERLGFSLAGIARTGEQAISLAEQQHPPPQLYHYVPKYQPMHRYVLLIIY